MISGESADNTIEITGAAASVVSGDAPVEEIVADRIWTQGSLTLFGILTSTIRGDVEDQVLPRGFDLPLRRTPGRSSKMIDHEFTRRD